MIAVQHKANDIVSEMLSFHTGGRAVSMTADHGVFVDGKLVAAGEAKVGSALSAGTIQRKMIVLRRSGRSSPVLSL